MVGPATRLELDLGRQRKDQPVGEQRILRVEVLLDLLHVLLLLGALVADELAGLIPTDPGDVRDQVDFLSRQA